jgi:hypothetical protein
MKPMIKLLAACAALAALCSPALANEYERNQNAQKPRQGTHDTRSAERKAKRADLKAEAKADGLPKSEENWGMNDNRPAAVSGTHDTRSAERKQKRAELKQVNKSGQMPVTNEAVVNQPRAAQ